MSSHTVNYGVKLLKGLRQVNEKLLTVHETTVHVYDNELENVPTIVFLHGFTGTLHSWEKVWQSLQSKYRIVAIDLMGHGKSEAPSEIEQYSMENQITLLEAVFDTLSLKDFTLVGYSMGGRVALSYAALYHERLLALVLESASPGLQTEDERKARRDSDTRLAERILENGIERFVDAWEDIPLFASQKKLPTAVQKEIRAERLSQKPEAMANSLRGIGTGFQSSNWEKLKELSCPVFLLTGEYDLKFIAIAKEMALHIPQCEHKTILEAGHAIHVEKPLLFATMIEEYLQNRSI